jgi:glutathione S-transferase
MKLFTTSRAPNPDRVRYFIAEKGITGIELVEVSLMKGEHRTPEYRAKNSVGRIPALELDDGTVISESRAICTYLEGIYPEPNLMGATPLERARIEMWDRRMELNLFFPIANAVRHGHPALSVLEKQIPDWAASSADTAQKSADWLERELSDGRAYLNGAFSIADITGYVAFGFGRMIKFRPWETRPHLNAWRDRVAARPGMADIK